MKIGIDFGTTNSAVAVQGPSGSAKVIQLTEGEYTQKTVIFSLERDSFLFGNRAYREYLSEDMQGRFLRSIKMFLPQDVPSTIIHGKKYKFLELVSMYLKFLSRATEIATGRKITHATIGRPVRFHENNSKNNLALKRLTEAAHDAFDFEFDFCIVRLHDINRLKVRGLTEFLSRSESRMENKYLVKRLRELIYNDLGYQLSTTIEKVKSRLSSLENCDFFFDEFTSDQLVISEIVEIAAFEKASSRITLEYKNRVEALLKNSGLKHEDVDDVFLTGGTSQLPFVRDIFADIFGQTKIRSFNALTSVCEGLAL